MLNSVLNWKYTFDHLARPQVAHGIYNLDGELLSLNSSSNLDSLTLGYALQSVRKFFPLQDGDFYLLNDPSCGGLGFRDLTFVGRVQSFHIVFRVEGPSPWSLEDKLDYMKIPPTPLIIQWAPQKDILAAISHALSSFSDLISEQLTWIEGLKTKFQFIEKQNPDLADKAKQKKYFQETHNYFLDKIKESFQNEFSVELKSKNGEYLKLKQSTSDHGLTFDFSGTSSSNRIFLHETWTRSLLNDFIFDLLDEKNLMNEASLKTIHIMQPMQAFTNSNHSGKNTFLSRRLGGGLLLTALHQGFQKSYRLTPWSVHNYFPLQLQIANSKDASQAIEFKIPSGSGQSLQKQYFDGLSIEPLTLARSKIQSLGLEITDLHPSHKDEKTTCGRGWQMKAKALQNMNLQYVGSALSENGAFIECHGQKNSQAFGELQISVSDEMIFSSGSGY